jgi:hypothetical protein
MTARSGRLLLATLALAAAAAACSEQLTQPGRCPELCPGGTPQSQEEILTALPGQDSTFTGYTERSSGSVMLVGSGIPALADTSFGVIKFAARSDSILFRDTLRAYTIDSIRLTLLSVARDTAARNVKVQLYRLPSSLDTTTVSYGGVSPFFIPANLITEAVLPDAAVADTLRLILKGSGLTNVTLQPADAGVLTIGVAITGNIPTGGRIGNRRSILPPDFITFVTPIATPTQVQGIDVAATFAGYVSRQTPVLDPTFLTVGGVPSSRVLLRFPWPARLRDSVTIVRATLELIPAQPVAGLPNDPGTLNVRGLATDFGAKSPAEPLSLGVLPLAANGTDTVRVEVATILQFWQIGLLRPPAVFLSVSPEVETFTRAVFGSTRSGSPPRIRLNYLPRFPFSRP